MRVYHDDDDVSGASRFKNTLLQTVGTRTLFGKETLINDESVFDNKLTGPYPGHKDSHFLRKETSGQPAEGLAESLFNYQNELRISSAEDTQEGIQVIECDQEHVKELEE